jgi:hypothetical protein
LLHREGILGQKSWLEQGTVSNKKRAYTCGLGGVKGHKRPKCPLRQEFAAAGVDVDDDANDEEEEEENAAAAAAAAHNTAAFAPHNAAAAAPHNTAAAATPWGL